MPRPATSSVPASVGDSRPTATAFPASTLRASIAPDGSVRGPQASWALCSEFHVERTDTFYRCELRDHGPYGVEAQFLDPVDLVIGRRYPTRELAVLWAEAERKALVADDADSCLVD